ncbi:sensor histidine kinase [Lachnospiraceae bacterium]|nr:sensor histidine kinase [Lachnospiraceae bacterium]
MKKWRYSIGLKAALIAAGQVFAVIFAICLMVLVILLQKNILNFNEKRNLPFESSGYFTNQFERAAEELLEFIELRKKFETNGSYDPEKIVDIQRYYERREISGKKQKKNAVAYKLGDLAEWSRSYATSPFEFMLEYEVDESIQQRLTIFRSGESIYSEEKPITSVREMAPELRDSVIEQVEYYYGGSYSVSGDSLIEQDATYHTDAQQEEMSIGVLEDVSNDREHQEVIQKVIQGQLYELTEEELKWLLVSMNSTRYVSMSVAYDFVDEDYLPLEGMGIWEAYMNGTATLEQMQNSFRALSYTLEQLGEELTAYRRCLNTYQQVSQGTNVYYWINEGRKNTIYTNINNVKASELPATGKKLGKYLFYRENDMHLETNISGMEDYFYQHIEPVYGNQGNVIFIGVDTSFPNADSFKEAKREYTQMYPWLRVCLWGGVISILMWLTCIIYLSIVAGKRDDTGEVHLNLLDRIPTEILFMIAMTGILIFIWATVSVLYQYDGAGFSSLLVIVGTVTFAGAAFLQIFYLSFVRRIRAGVLWSGSILSWFFCGVGLLFTSRKSLTKMVVFYGVHLLACLIILPMIAMYYNQDIFVTGVAMFSILCGVEAVMIIREGAQRNKVLEGISKIASGDLEYKIEENKLKGDNRRLAHAVNDIGEGLHRAADASLKNERLQADLITNVSHDIKTPLTSIINYVDLLKREKLENERARSYIAVLESKSQRLKQLAEDLVEASRISSGNIKLELERINLVELVHQTEGEFAGRFEARGLNVISNLPRESVVILADGRRIWRVLENLYNNVAKYAMEHTRVYVDMYADGEQVLFSIKNISENPLNIEADELTERFIRGDISRSTEGSGLGLSIAKNLMNLMGGTFQIYLDGDLFKVMIGFKQEHRQREEAD